ncbi:hypothetical protein C2S52_014209 [Perilla frutescens var. hirtella]|nr:hypothetical protein C2S52_014209 [Perilla frutescens var. hirtella]
MQSPFCPRVVEKLMNSEVTRQSLTTKIIFVVGEINAEAEEIQKVVDALPHRMTLLTFSVREVSSMVIKTVQSMVYTEVYDNHELREWRFKPEE